MCVPDIGVYCPDPLLVVPVVTATQESTYREAENPEAGVTVQATLIFVGSVCVQGEVLPHTVRITEEGAAGTTAAKAGTAGESSRPNMARERMRRRKADCNWDPILWSLSLDATFPKRIN